MITISSLVESLISRKPFLEESLAEGLINLSSVARYLQTDIESKLGRPVKTGAIVMALKRHVSEIDLKLGVQLRKVTDHLGDVSVRSKLSDYTYRNSDQLIEKLKRLLKIISDQQDIFFTFSQGTYETTIVISSSLGDQLENLFSGEKQVMKTTGLSSVTLKLPNDNVKMTGLYYFILKKIAWNKINIQEVISTTNEFTIVVEEKDAGRAFNVLKDLKE